MTEEGRQIGIIGEPEPHLDEGKTEQGLILPSSAQILPMAKEIELPGGINLDEIIRTLGAPAQGLTEETRKSDIEVRQNAVSQFLLPGGPDTVRAIFARAKELGVRINWSHLDISGYILGGLHIPSPNFEKIVMAETDLSGSNIPGVNLTEAIGPKVIMRGVIASGGKAISAILPGADMRGGRFVGMDFTNAIMNGVILDDQTNFAGAIFNGAHLVDVDIDLIRRFTHQMHGVIT